ncbi:hypothetical protein D3C87_1880980 [compost metagenome]
MEEIQLGLEFFVFQFHDAQIAFVIEIVIRSDRCNHADNSAPVKSMHLGSFVAGSSGGSQGCTDTDANRGGSKTAFFVGRAGRELKHNKNN